MTPLPPNVIAFEPTGDKRPARAGEWYMQAGMATTIRYAWSDRPSYCTADVILRKWVPKE